MTLRFLKTTYVTVREQAKLLNGADAPNMCGG